MLHETSFQINNMYSISDQHDRALELLLHQLLKGQCESDSSIYHQRPSPRAITLKPLISLCSTQLFKAKRHLISLHSTQLFNAKRPFKRISSTLFQHRYKYFFSSPGPKVQVNYCHHLASVVCKLFTFQASSPKPLGRLEPNLSGMFLGWSSTKLLFFVPVGYSLWLPGPIICSDWLKFQRSSSLKLMN